MALKITMQAINEVVGDTEGDTQATQVCCMQLLYSTRCIQHTMAQRKQGLLSQHGMCLATTITTYTGTK